jgi:hypothetical protein
MSDPPDEKEEKVRALDEDDIALLKTYGQGPYSSRIKEVEKDVKDIVKKVNEVSGIKESDTGLAPPSRWDLVSDKQAMQEEQPLQVRWWTPPAWAVQNTICCWLSHACMPSSCRPVLRSVSASLTAATGALRRSRAAPRSSSPVQRRPSTSSTSSRLPRQERCGTLACACSSSLESALPPRLGSQPHVA